MFLLNLQRYFFMRRTCSTKKVFGVEFYRRQCVNVLGRYSSNPSASPIPTSFVALGISNSILASSKNRFILRNNAVRMK